jgi:flagellar motor switch protein FliG
MTGLEKAALIIMQMSQDRAAEVMRQFSEAEAEEIAAGIMRMRKVEASQADAAITEFHAKTQSGRAEARGGRDAAVTLLEASFGEERAAGLIDRVSSTVGGRSFEFLDSVEPILISRVLDGEMPETVALVLAHLRPEAASVVLTRFDTPTRVDIAQALATMGAASQPIIEVVAEALKVRVRSASTPSATAEVVGGVQPLVDIMQRSDIATEHELLEELDRRDPGLAEDVRSRLLSFEDLVKLEARDVQQVIRGIDAAQLAIALKGADEAIIALVRENMSERNRELVDDEISLLGKVRKQQVMEARAELIKAMRELEAQGSLMLVSATGEDDDLVD